MNSWRAYHATKYSIIREVFGSLVQGYLCPRYFKSREALGDEVGNFIRLELQLIRY